MSKAAVLFTTLATLVKTEGASLVPKVKGVFVFEIDGKSWTVDLKNGSGAVYEGTPKEGTKADVTFVLSDDNFANLIAQKVKAPQLVMGGKMKLKGNMALAMKFETVLKTLAPKAKL